MIDFTTVLVDLDGKPIMDAVKYKHKDGKPVIDDEGEPVVAHPGVEVTLSRVARNALMAAFPDERELAGDDKLLRSRIAGKCQGKAVALTAEEVTLIKRLIGKAYPPLVVGQAWPLLDPACVKP